MLIYQIVIIVDPLGIYIAFKPEIMRIMLIIS